MPKLIRSHQLHSLKQNAGDIARAEGIHRLVISRAKHEPNNPLLMEKVGRSQEILFRERAKRQAFIEEQKRKRVF